MSRVMPKNIVIEFDDGSHTSVPIESLPMNIQIDLLRQPFASTPSSAPEKEKFVFLEWDDGWREVIEVDAACTDINRYYVITRPEDMGRLSLNKKDDYPELIEIIRKPMNLKKITFSGTHELALDKSIREGKKTDHFFACNRNGDSLSELKDSFRKALEDEGVSLEELKSKDGNQLRGLFGRMKKRMDIKAGEREQDVFDFMAFFCHEG
ncbi:MAG: hypothetical protein ABIG67_05105 [Pseudomonadota bacterium]